MTEKRTHVLVVGEFNHLEIKWEDESSPTDIQHSASLFMEAGRDSFLIQHVNKPTHFWANQTPNVLDLVFTNEQAMIDTVRHETPLGKSHHQTLFFNLNCYTPKTYECFSFQFRQRWLW
jgi:hypothetical protein